MAAAQFAQLPFRHNAGRNCKGCRPKPLDEGVLTNLLAGHEFPCGGRGQLWRPVSFLMERHAIVAQFVALLALLAIQLLS